MFCAAPSDRDRPRRQSCKLDKAPGWQLHFAVLLRISDEQRPVRGKENRDPMSLGRSKINEPHTVLVFNEEVGRNIRADREPVPRGSAEIDEDGFLVLNAKRRLGEHLGTKARIGDCGVGTPYKRSCLLVGDQVVGIVVGSATQRRADFMAENAALESFPLVAIRGRRCGEQDASVRRHCGGAADQGTRQRSTLSANATIKDQEVGLAGVDHYVVRGCLRVPQQRQQIVPPKATIVQVDVSLVVLNVPMTAVEKVEMRLLAHGPVRSHQLVETLHRLANCGFGWRYHIGVGKEPSGIEIHIRQQDNLGTELTEQKCVLNSVVVGVAQWFDLWIR
jgi:hypothetical protein